MYMMRKKKGKKLQTPKDKTNIRREKSVEFILVGKIKSDCYFYLNISE